VTEGSIMKFTRMTRLGRPRTVIGAVIGTGAAGLAAVLTRFPWRPHPRRLQ
jgi:hypothetical protein